VSAVCLCQRGVNADVLRVAPGSPRLCAVLLQVSDALGGAGSQQHRPRDLPGAAAWSSLL
jgi:hypothetical protein